MPFQQNLIGYLTATLLLTLGSKSTFAFTLTPTQPGDSDGTYRYSDSYDNGQGEVTLDAWPVWDGRRYLPSVGMVHEIRPGGTDDLLSLLNKQFGNFWEFVPKGNLNGSFNVENYYPCNPNYACTLDGGRISNAVGAAFKLNYFPEADDPVGNTIHWIQRILVNWSIDENGQVINDQVAVDRLDITPGARSPYYDESFPGAANSNVFRDLPHIQIPYTRTNHYFHAETYLVNEILGGTVDPETGIVKRKVEIYNGVKWGWENKFIPNNFLKMFSETLTSGNEVDNFTLNGLTPGASFSAWIDNNLTTNQCNPNTLLSAYHPSGFGSGYDDNSSPVGDGFASAVSGIIGRDGIINFSVQAATPGARGEDRGNYNLYVNLKEIQKSPPPEVPEFNMVAGSGGGGVGNETPGRRQQNPILPNTIDQQGWQIFSNVPGCRWYDPPTTYGFEFQALENTLFTEILDFPFGDDNLFTVSTGNQILGEFSPGQNVDFVSLLGGGVKSFNITGIDSIFGPTQETAFPIQLAFNKNTGSFKMRPIYTPKSVPEPHSIFGLFTLGIWAGFQALKIKKSKQP